MTREEAAMSELDAARERYKRHLAAIENTGYGYYLSDTERMHDMQLLARAACEGGDAKDAARYRDALLNLRRYVACEGYSDNEGSLVVGLAHDGAVWGPVVNPNVQAYELAEAVEKWLHAKIDAAIDAAREAQS